MNALHFCSFLICIINMSFTEFSHLNASKLSVLVKCRITQTSTTQLQSMFMPSYTYRTDAVRPLKESNRWPENLYSNNCEIRSKSHILFLSCVFLQDAALQENFVSDMWSKCRNSWVTAQNVFRQVKVTLQNVPDLHWSISCTCTHHLRPTSHGLRAAELSQGGCLHSHTHLSQLTAAAREFSWTCLRWWSWAGAHIQSGQDFHFYAPVFRASRLIYSAQCWTQNLKILSLVWWLFKKNNASFD